jgi:plasmid stabilization system protein ParE
MKRRVQIAAKAQNDLTAIFYYVAADSRRMALRLIDKLESAAFGLAETALHYPVVRHRAGIPVRRRVVGTYNILYSLADDQVEVLHVLHGKRSIDLALNPSDED